MKHLYPDFAVLLGAKQPRLESSDSSGGDISLGCFWVPDISMVCWNVLEAHRTGDGEDGTNKEAECSHEEEDGNEGTRLHHFKF